MKRVFAVVRLGVGLLAWTCAATAADVRTAPPDADFVLWEACTREQAGRWAATAESDGLSALRAASCYAVLCERGTDRSTQLADARRGRKAAESAVRAFPGSGSAHYLAAYLAGLEAERVPWQGLKFVSIIEKEALIAATLNPGIDRGGPDRMLGELYLRAPGFPLSVGNARKAVVHFRRALSQAPGFAGNRVGLSEALLADERTAEACGELANVLEGAPSASGHEAAMRRALELRERRCSGQPGE